MTRRLLRAARREDGFTLTEVLVAMTFIGVMFALFATVVASAIRHNDEVTEQTTLQAEARAAIDQFAQDLRSAYSGEEDVPPIESMSGTAITFLSPDRQEPFHLRRVSYQLTSGQLQRREAVTMDTDGAPWTFGSFGPWTTRLDSIVNATVFTYRDANDAVTNVPADVAEVVITITIASASSTNRQYTYTTSVTLREGSAL